MKNNSGQPSTPSEFFTNRLRLCSVNSPFISPLRIMPSPYIDENNFLNPLQANAQLNHFQLQEESNPIEKQDEQVHEQVSKVSEKQAPQILDEKNDDYTVIDESNCLEFVLNNINKNQKNLEDGRKKLEVSGCQFNLKLFDYLVVKFKKLRKTKEEMVKYCVRKSFKFITNKMRAANKELFANMENNEVVAEYFERNCEGDLSISMPFKRNSEQKTMNASFLKKIFKCRQYNVDYRVFLSKLFGDVEQFPAEFHSDNRKKVKSMNNVIKKCIKNKCLKSLDEYKRLPWTLQILQKIFQFAKKLTEHSPYKKQQIDQKAMEKNCEISQTNQQNLLSSSYELKLPAKKSIIFLTPPVKALEDPENVSDEDLFD